MEVAVAHVEQPVVQVLAVGAERRLARAQPAEHGEAEVEEGHDEHRERQQDRDERGEQAARAEHVVGAARAGESTGSICPVTATAEAAISIPTRSAPASPMKSRAGCQLSGRNPAHAPITTAAMNCARLK